MARLPHVPEPPEDPVVSEVFAGFQREGRSPIALYRVLAHAPQTLRAYSGVGRALRYETTASRGLIELVILRVAQLTGSEYEWLHHKPMALRQGVSLHQVEALSTWEDSDAFDERERAVLRCVDESHRLAVTDATFRELQRLFTPTVIVEVLVAAAHYQAVARVLQGLDVEVEEAYQEDRA